MPTFAPNWQRTNVDMQRLFMQTRPHSAMRLRALVYSQNLIRASSSATDTGAPSTLPIPRVVLKGNKSRLFTDNQSPTVYGGAIDRVVGRPQPKAGDIVLVANGAEETFAWGLFNPTSMYRVRIMQTLDDVDEGSLTNPDISALLRDRIQAAVALRLTISLPSVGTTNVYRLVNSEGDRLSGLVVDVLGDVAVVQSSAAWVECRKDLIQNLLKEHTQVKDIVWRQAAELLKEEGWIKEESEGNGAEEESEVATKEIVAVEAGLKYVVDPTGQKTGFYCDQRDHRAFIRSLSDGKDVLDVCCYSGGFALNAAAGGAASALGVDSSGPAVDLARKNAELNGFSEKCTFEKADAATFMKSAASEGKQWDILVLDPPKLAPSKKALDRAWRKYESLNAAAMKLVRPGGLLMTCSCSGAVALSGEFIPMLQRAARRAKRRVTVLRIGSAAADHPLDPGYPEGAYLTNVTVIVQ